MIPFWVKPLALLVVLASLLAGVYFFAASERRAGFEAGQAELKTAIDKATAEAVSAAQHEAAVKQADVEESHAKDIEFANKRIADGAAARTGLERLLARLRGAAPTGGAAPVADAGPGSDGPPLRELFGACAERYERVAEEAQQLAGQVIGLQGYVCAVTKIRGDSPVGARPCVGIRDLATQPTTAPSEPNLVTAAPPTQDAP